MKNGSSVGQKRAPTSEEKRSLVFENDFSDFTLPASHGARAHDASGSASGSRFVIRLVDMRSIIPRGKGTRLRESPPRSEFRNDVLFPNVDCLPECIN